ncbi:glutaredoxin family protein [Blastopirellula marina]|uniref:Glutaredoxin family protein n=1 Tax=Blastopirellula marina TaxID=124 RepID=A0A2S8GTU6_9BACT|nr:glutaredoxin family protein [Blastopirellula marina]PQO47801.1 glutaredoxin family protein [Blastopirellula marina]
MNMPNQPKSEAQVVIYTRQGCHLCDDAAQLVEPLVSDITYIDIDADPALAQKFNTCVPVVEINGKIRFRGKVSPMLLKRLLQAEAGKTASPRPA